MKFKLAVFLILIPLTASASNLQKDFNNLSFHQLMVLRQAYLKGLPSNLNYTMAAIVWKESNCGEWNINLSDPSASWYHIKIKTAMKYLSVRNTKFNMNRVAQWLINNPSKAGDIALSELKYWLRCYKGSWKKAVGSYNGGWHPNYNYERDIVRRIRVLRRNFR